MNPWSTFWTSNSAKATVSQRPTQGQCKSPHSRLAGVHGNTRKRCCARCDNHADQAMTRTSTGTMGRLEAGSMHPSDRPYSQFSAVQGDGGILACSAALRWAPSQSRTRGMWHRAAVMSPASRLHGVDMALFNPQRDDCITLVRSLTIQLPQHLDHANVHPLKLCCLASPRVLSRSLASVAPPLL
jgi:hypothetical protein